MEKVFGQSYRGAMNGNKINVELFNLLGGGGGGGGGGRIVQKVTACYSEGLLLQGSLF